MTSGSTMPVSPSVAAPFPVHWPQPVHTRSKTRTRRAASSTANTMNPKSPTSRDPPSRHSGRHAEHRVVRVVADPGQQRHEHVERLLREALHPPERAGPESAGYAGLMSSQSLKAAVCERALADSHSRTVRGFERAGGGITACRPPGISGAGFVLAQEFEGVIT
jgi:hypothetical protein